jgi:class 3 adenylate cyclase
VRAALSIQRSLVELNRKNEATDKPALAARIAIDTGPAVLDGVGEIFGDVANVAARAQALGQKNAPKDPVACLRGYLDCLLGRLQRS